LISHLHIPSYLHISHTKFNFKMGSIEPTKVGGYGSLEGKVALVTGSGRGIGRGIALELAKRGASVVINYAASSKPAQEAVKAIESTGSKGVAIQGDMTKVADIRRVFKEAIDHFGRLDIVMSNSGTESFKKEEDVTEEDYDKVFALNTRAQFFVAQEALKTLQHGGRIILMSSVAATSEFSQSRGPLQALQGSKSKYPAFQPPWS
jgi:3-oxoacyl-[acyl-carrier protein] reductase